MTMVLAALIAAVQLGGAFGSATASTVSLGATSMIVDLEVEVTVEAQSVVAHLSIDDDVAVLPLLARGEGVYGLRTELSLKNYVVVFEVLGEEGSLSAPSTLTQLGVELSVAPDDAGEEPFSDDTTRWGWLGLALGAASLSLLAFWVLGDRDGRGRDRRGASGAADDDGASPSEE